MAGSKTFGATTPTGTPTTGKQRSAPQITSRLNELLGFVNEFFDLSISANFNKFFKMDASGEVESAFGITTDGKVVFSGTPSAGQYFKFDGADTASPQSLSTFEAWVEKTSGFNPADNGRYACDTSGGAFNATLNFATTSVDEEFTITPTENSDFVANPVTVVRNGAESIAGIAEDFICNVNGTYHFRGSTAGNWSVSLSSILRS